MVIQYLISILLSFSAKNCVKEKKRLQKNKIAVIDKVDKGCLVLTVKQFLLK